MARVLRKMGRLDEARAVLEPLTAGPHPPAEVVAEIGQIELESGNYKEAERWFAQADLDQPNDQETLPGAAGVFALAGNVVRAERLFVRFDAANWRSLRIYDLRVGLAIDPDDRQAAVELQRLLSPSRAASSGVDLAGETLHGSPALLTSDVYARHCSACHGAGGDGNGRAARHLFPRPRDLRTGKFRLVRAREKISWAILLNPRKRSALGFNISPC